MTPTTSSPGPTRARPRTGVAPREDEPAPENSAGQTARPAAPPALQSTGPSVRTRSGQRLEIPPILLEGDAPSSPALSGPGQKYVLSPRAPPESAEAEGELPAAYGTGELLLIARDPHCLYAHWDFTAEQQRALNLLSVHRHLVLRIVPHEPAPLTSPAQQPRGSAALPSTGRADPPIGGADPPIGRADPPIGRADLPIGRADLPVGQDTWQHVQEIHVHPESRHWFVHVDRAAARYVAELGLYREDRTWETISTSRPAATPPNTVSADTSGRFAVMGERGGADRLAGSGAREKSQAQQPRGSAALPSIGSAALPSIGSADLQSLGSADLQSLGSADLQSLGSADLQSLGSADLQSLGSADLPVGGSAPQPMPAGFSLSMPGSDIAGPGTIDIAELLRRRFEHESASQAAAQFGAPGPLAEMLGGVSSPSGQPPARGFWFNVSAELIVYGVTEPAGAVTVAGQQIQLRPDGSFSFRLALPDGEHELPVVAVSADGRESRAARLWFSRRSEHFGAAAAPRQEPAAQPSPAG